jgi:hypothetical protein
MTRQQGVYLSALGLVATGAVTGLAVGLDTFSSFELAGWAKLALIVAVIAATGALSWQWWKHLDEVAREAQKFGWYWGGSAGIVAAGTVLILVDSGRMAPPAFLLQAASNPFVAGGMTVLGAQMIGFVIVWAGWWLAHR